MKKTLMLVVIILSMTVVAFGQNKGQDAIQTPTVKTTGVQGNLTELTGTLGRAKSFVVGLETNKPMISYSFDISAATEAIQDTKDLLDKYDYPDEVQILRQVLDLEQRLFKVVMSL